MGFGTLLVGYFLLLNVTYYSFTDLIGALIITLALYKLRGINDFFKYGIMASGVFAALGAAELVFAALSMFGTEISIPTPVSSVREFIICIITVLMLLGIRSVADEVDLPKISARAKRMLPIAFTVYPLTIILDAPFIFDKVAPVIVAAVFTLTLVATMFLVIYNLITIYSCYMYICMPSEVEIKEKRSKLDIVNKFREHETEKVLEYQKYKAEKMKKRSGKK